MTCESLRAELKYYPCRWCQFLSELDSAQWQFSAYIFIVWFLISFVYCVLQIMYLVAKTLLFRNLFPTSCIFVLSHKVLISLAIQYTEPRLSGPRLAETSITRI